jgi:hypothetical protein
VYYPVAAGGKFTINSLSLSKNCVLLNRHLAHWELGQSDLDVLYHKKLNTILYTVPENAFDGNWQQYELSYHVSQSLYQKKFSNSVLELNQKIIDQKKHFCIECHSSDEIKFLLSTYPTAQILKLTNYIEWMTLCKSKARIEDIEDKQAYWKHVDQLEVKSSPFDWAFLIDMDDSMHSMSVMQAQIESLYKKLGFDDFNESRWQQYYKKYAQSHNLVNFE